MTIEDLIMQGSIKKINVNTDIIKKEIKEAKNDFVDAKYSLIEEKYKWVIIQAYYSIFHIAKAFAYSQGYKEKTHHGLMLLLEQFMFMQMIDEEYYYNFKTVLRLRQRANYDNVYSKKEANDIIYIAEQYLSL